MLVQALGQGLEEMAALGGPGRKGTAEEPEAMRLDVLGQTLEAHEVLGAMRAVEVAAVAVAGRAGMVAAVAAVAEALEMQVMEIQEVQAVLQTQPLIIAFQ